MNIKEKIQNCTYIDFHTHKKTFQNNTFGIINLLINKIQLTIIDKSNLYSVGLHPWYIKYQTHCIPDIITLLSDSKNFIAVGEIGLDRLITVPIEKQIEVFLKQVNIAVSFHKPIIIHCVKAYSDILELFRKYNLLIPAVFHSYNENEHIADELLKYNVYFSFGKNLFNHDSKAAKVLKQLDASRVFFETDDADCTIEDIYKNASEITGRDESFWINQCKKNFTSFLNYE
ncbi:MAG: TatD family hydrolase [Marinilabiliales bacterium]